MQEVKMIYNHHTNTVEVVKPYYEWTVFIRDTHGNTETTKVWAQDEYAAEEDAIYSSNLSTAHVMKVIKSDELKQLMLEANL
jgi:hypothetical protein